MSEKNKNMIEFTYEERQQSCSLDWDAYIYAGVSTEIDCEIFGGPPAGPVVPNIFGLRVLSIQAKDEINRRWESQGVAQIHAYIAQVKKEIAGLTYPDSSSSSDS